MSPMYVPSPLPAAGRLLPGRRWILRSVGIRVPGRCTRSRPAGRAPASGQCACAGGAVLPRASAAITAVEHLVPGHRVPCGDISRQARHSRRPWASSQAFGGAAPVNRCTERRWGTGDCRQTHPVGEAPSRRAYRGIGQNHIPEGWAEAGVRGRGRWVSDWAGSMAGPSVWGSSISKGPAAGGEASWVSPCTAARFCSGSVSRQAGSSAMFRLR